MRAFSATAEAREPEWPTRPMRLILGEVFPVRLPKIGETARSCFGFALELGRVLLVLPSVEYGRRRTPPGALLAAMRARGSARRARPERSLARLARAIGWADRFSPGGPNCLRRTLLRVALDPQAAREPVILGLNVPGTGLAGTAKANGHAWLASTETSGRFDVEFRV
jgi:hypothetical protein